MDLKESNQVLRENVIELIRLAKSSVKLENPVEDNVQFNGQYIHDVEEVLLRTLIVLKDTTNDLNVRMVKGDGYNTNLVFDEFLKSNPKQFKIIITKTSIQYSIKLSDKQVPELMLNETIQIASYTYTPNFLFGDSRYEVLLEMPWQVADDTKLNHSNCWVCDEKDYVYGTVDSSSSARVEET